MTKPIGIGLIGCGHISEIYLKNAPRFDAIKIIACADIVPEAAKAKAEAHGIEAMTVEALLDDNRIGIILNLTTPQHHVPVGLAALNAGKHVYAEKPLALDVDEALALVDIAAVKGLRVGSAPDTFLGGAHQTARAAIDADKIGQVLSGTAFMMVPGHERWHHNPDFYYKPGGGPLLDMGPYYLTALVNMLGPVGEVSGMSSTGFVTRIIATGPRAGEEITVEVPTHVTGILQFVSGAIVTLTTSFDVKAHGHSHIELYGTDATMEVADPNQFEGDIRIRTSRDGDWTTLPQVHNYGDDNYRVLGLADMAQAIIDDRPHRASLDMALHVLNIMESITLSAETGERITLKTTCVRPEPMNPDLAVGQL